MPHQVFNLGDQPAATVDFFRQLVAGQGVAEGAVIGASRARRAAILLQDAWIEVNDFDAATEDFHQMKYSLALSNTRPPTTASLLLPVGRIYGSGVGATNPNAIQTEQLFKAQGSIWVAQYIGISIQEAGAVVIADVDVHLDWTATSIDWWDWFVKWNELEEFPDGSLVDGERQYA